MTSQSSSQSQSANDSRISSASANETNDDERVNESGERGQFVHFKESFVRTDSFANEPTLVTTCERDREREIKARATGLARWVVLVNKQLQRTRRVCFIS